MMQTLAILGASGHGKVIADAALASGWKHILFFDDAWPKTSQVGPWSVVGTTEQMIQESAGFDAAVIGIGDNLTRLCKASMLVNTGIQFATIVHPRAVVSPYATVGAGSVVFAGAVLNPSSVIGEHCIINTNVTIEHDCTLENGVHISPGANLAGQVFVGERSWVGMGANIRQLVQVGRDVMVGAGAVVVRNISNQATVVGVPAKRILNREGCRA